MNKVLTIIILYFVNINYLFSENKQTDSILFDTASVEVRMPDEQIMEDYKQQRDFQYIEVSEPKLLWDKFFYWLYRILKAMFSDKGIAPIIRYSVILLFFVFVIYKILGSEFKGMFVNTDFDKQLTENEKFIENIDALDLDKLIATEINRKEYRKAIRYSFLKILKLLNEKQLIEWKQNKTNSDYLNEIKQPDIFKKFKLITMQFEAVWY